MSANIVDSRLSFGSLSRRSKTTYLILHHAAAENTSVETIHQWHRSKGWAGIGYNFYIRQDGTIYKGRGWEYIGAHAANYNSISVGICFEGNFENTSKSMSEAQYNSGAAMIALALKKYPAINTICGHRGVDTTACPGQHFPLDEMIEMGKSGYISSGLSDTDSNGCPYGNSTAMVKSGSTGMAVLRCQWYLNKADNAGLTIDGICGSKTAAAIRALQTSRGLDADGICGPKTWIALESAVLAQNSINSISAEKVGVAIETLANAGVIDTPSYWLINYDKLQFLDELLINLSGLTYQTAAGIDITNAEEAAAKLASVGAINTPDYWIANHSRVHYIDQLMIKAANRL